MDQGTLVTEQIEAGATFLGELQKTIPVTAAFWLTEYDAPITYLYVASDDINDKSIKSAYGEVLRVAAEMSDPNLNPFRVKLIKSGDPLARAAIDFHEGFPTKRAARLRDIHFGGVGAEEVYLYGMPIVASGILSNGS
jgi:hypothetical protein